MFHNIVLVLVAVGFLLINPLLLRHFYIETASVSYVSEVGSIGQENIHLRLIFLSSILLFILFFLHIQRSNLSMDVQSKHRRIGINVYVRSEIVIHFKVVVTV